MYRVEHKRKKMEGAYCFAGPYGVSNVVESSEWTERAHTAPRNPPPDEDEKIMELMQENPDYECWQGDLHCGFSSMEQLKNWFSVGELRKLSSLGFVIACYNVDATIEGKTQVLFLPSGGRRKIIDIMKEIYK